VPPRAFREEEAFRHHILGQCVLPPDGSGGAGFPSEKYHSNGDHPDGASREFMLFSQNTIKAFFMTLRVRRFSRRGLC
jgi:hypothetical protein